MPSTPPHTSPRVLLASWVALGLISCASDLEEEEVTNIDQELVGGAQAVDGEWDSAIFWIVNGGSCGGAVVGPRHVLTAAHCVQTLDLNNNYMLGTLRSALFPGQNFSYTHDNQLDDQTTYYRTRIEKTLMHPQWVSSCARGCPFSNSMVAPYPPDLAIVILEDPFPAQIPHAKIDLGLVTPDTPVSIVGYGCEDGLGMGFRQPGKLKFYDTRTLDHDAADHRSAFVPSQDTRRFERGYVITPGQDTYNEASLCSADSGSPLYLTDVTDGEVIVGVNAYYSFTNIPSGISTTNAHTRLGWDNPTGTALWMFQNLPRESFTSAAPLGALDGATSPTRQGPVQEGTPAPERLEGAALDDTLRGAAGEDHLLGMEGSDTLEGGSGSDSLFGGAGDDWLDGGHGVDILDGGPGYDVLRGGPGADIYILTPESDHDLIFDDPHGPNKIICRGFAEKPKISQAGEDYIVMARDGSASMRAKKSSIKMFYGCW